MSSSASNPGKRIWCAVPVYNNSKTLRGVVEGCLHVLENVIVVDDGSTDADVAELIKGLGAVLLRHPVNLGKGVAILAASKYVEEMGGTYLITIDADGQHDPEDIRKFIQLLSASDREDTLLVGCRDFDTQNVPGKSRFGRDFANFWFRVETGLLLDDCQSGFRAYPVRHINRMRFLGSRYDFEAEVLALAAWAGLKIAQVDVTVKYDPPEKRVSHFKPFIDNLRISRVHALLVLRRLLPLPHKRLVAKERADLRFLLHPIKVLKYLLKEHATPSGLAASAAVGIFLATLPLISVHTIAILYVTTRLNLNKIVAVNVQHVCMPPFVPALCIEVGYFMRHGVWLTDISYETIFRQFPERLLEWLLGSLVLAPIGAVLAGILVYFASAALLRRRAVDAE